MVRRGNNPDGGIRRVDTRLHVLLRRGQHQRYRQRRRHHPCCGDGQRIVGKHVPSRPDSRRRQHQHFRQARLVEVPRQQGRECLRRQRLCRGLQPFRPWNADLPRQLRKPGREHNCREHRRPDFHRLDIRRVRGFAGCSRAGQHLPHRAARRSGDRDRQLVGAGRLDRRGWPADLLG